MQKIPIYIRVSSDDQVHGTSLQSQLQECKAALKRDGQTPGEVFADEGESAKSIETRPAFLRLLDHIKEYRPTAVMVHKIDRFARNNLEAQIVRSKLTKLGCRLLSATEAISDDPSGKFMFDVLSAVAEYDNRLRSERCRQGMVSQVAQGWWVHGPPLGYNTARTAQNKPTLTPDDTRAPMIAEAFRLAASGVQQVEILSKVTAMGLTTKSGKKVTAQTLSRILSNPTYAGLIQGKLAGDKPMKGRWPAIISEEIYAKAQDRGASHLCYAPTAQISFQSPFLRANSKASRFLSPRLPQNCPGRLKRPCNCEQADSMAPEPRGKPCRLARG